MIKIFKNLFKKIPIRSGDLYFLKGNKEYLERWDYEKVSLVKVDIAGKKKVKCSAYYSLDHYRKNMTHTQQTLTIKDLKKLYVKNNVYKQETKQEAFKAEMDKIKENE